MGGSQYLATAVVDIDYATDQLTLVDAVNNPSLDYAAVDGLIQDNSDEGRLGWALAGDWDPNADPSGTLASPCDMALLSSADWVLEAEFTAAPDASGTSTLHLRRESDIPAFALSFSDLCGTEALTEPNGGIDEIVDATILVSYTCSEDIFADDFESGDMDNWSFSVP
jgi:hypothetical protein